MAPQNLVSARVRGLSTYNSDLSQSQPDYLHDCNNIVINRDNVAESRRGNKIYGNAMGVSPTTDTAKQLATYKKRLLRHYGTILQWDDGAGVFTSFSGTFTEVDPGLRVKSLEANGNFFVTTDDGIMKISSATANSLSSADISDAGGVKALDLEGYVDYSQTGFFSQDSAVAYRIVWGIKDQNQNLVLGVPSSRLVLKNPIQNLMIRDVNRLLHSLDVAAAVGGGTLSDTDYLSTLKLTISASALDIYTNLVALCTKLDSDMGGTTYATIAGTHTAPSTNPTSAELTDLQLFYDEIVDALLSESLVNITAAQQIAGDFQNSTQSAIAVLNFTIPERITSDAFFYQVYRTALTTSSGASSLDDLDPGDEMQLVFEGNTTSAERTIGQITYTDIVPDSFRGANLYTNPQSGEGIAQANEVPPLAKDIASFKNSVFYANTKTKHRLTINLLGISNLVPGTSEITITNGTNTNRYTFVSAIAQVVDIVHVAGANYTSSGTSDYFDIYSTTTHYRVWFQSGTSVAPASGGGTLIQVTITGAETATQAAVKTYNTLNVFNDFTMVTPVTPTLVVTNSVKGPADPPTETVVDVGFTIAATTPGSGNDESQQLVAISDAATPAQKVDETARNLVEIINRNSNETIYAFYLSGPDDVPGLISLEARELGTAPFYVLADSTGTGQEFSPDLSPSNFITVISVANPTVVTSAAHGLVTGDQIFISGSDSTPSIDGIQTVTFVDANNFTIPVNVTVGGTTGGWVLKSLAVVSDNEIAPNRVYYSKSQQPEAVPLLNFFDIGPKDDAILRILALRDSLFILKEEGIYRISGEGASSGFIQALFDSSALIQAADSAVVLNNQIFMFSNQGIAVISDTGVSIVSRPIEDLLLPLVLHDNFTTATFGVTYESDRSYLIWSTTLADDETATQCFRYNTFTNNWTKWEIEKTCGLILHDKLYLGAGDTNFIEIERKNFDRTDYSDREISKPVPDNNVTEDEIQLGSVTLTSVGDVFFQEQYLTIYKLTQLLKKLDDDMGTNDKNYESTLGPVPGDNLRTTLADLATKLDSDTGVADSTFSAAISTFTSSFPDTQAAYNVIVVKLNLNPNLIYSNYATSTGTVKYEAIVLSVDDLTNIITVNLILPWIAGDALIFNHIPIRIEWNPQFFNDPEQFKQVSETKFIFERTNFTTATVSYASDQSPAFEEYSFNKQGNGAFGLQVFGETNFGGDADKTPFRTLVPRNKQRCQYLIPKIIHEIARERMGTIGYSMFFTAYSVRSYQR